jgi:hypothetical protein
VKLQAHAKLVCLMPARNEDWILGLSARAALLWVDHLVLLDHASTDRTSAVMAEVANEFPDRVTVLVEGDPVWEEMRHRQRLLETSRALGATHIVTVDADEILTGNLLDTIRERVLATPAGLTMMLPWQCLRGQACEVMVSGIWGVANACVAFQDGPECHWAARDGYDFHHRQPMGRPFAGHLPIGRGAGGLMHLQFVGARRLLAKQALYKMQEVLRWPGRDSLGAINARYDFAVYGAQQAEVWATPPEWWAPYWGLMRYTDFSNENTPWQEIEVRRLWAEYGSARFAGLDLFGVVA